MLRLRCNLLSYFGQSDNLGDTPRMMTDAPLLGLKITDAILEASIQETARMKTEALNRFADQVKGYNHLVERIKRLEKALIAITNNSRVVLLVPAVGSGGPEE